MPAFIQQAGYLPGQSGRSHGVPFEQIGKARQHHRAHDTHRVWHARSDRRGQRFHARQALTLLGRHGEPDHLALSLIDPVDRGHRDRFRRNRETYAGDLQWYRSLRCSVPRRHRAMPPPGRRRASDRTWMSAPSSSPAPPLDEGHATGSRPVRVRGRRVPDGLAFPQRFRDKFQETVLAKIAVATFGEDTRRELIDGIGVPCGSASLCFVQGIGQAREIDAPRRLVADHLDPAFIAVIEARPAAAQHGEVYIGNLFSRRR